MVGLFLIVYSILCFTSSNVGCILSVPCTFLVGSFTPIALLVMAVFGAYMLFFKKLFKSLKPIQIILISLIVIFALVLATSVEANKELTFQSCFSKYIDLYKWDYKFLIAN